jgi:hypothetical protein
MGDLDDGGVGGGIAVSFIDSGQPVDIDREIPAGIAVALGIDDGMLKRIGQSGAIGQAGQFVEIDLQLDLDLLGLAAIDHAQNSALPHRQTGLRKLDPAAIVHPDEGAVRPAQPVFTVITAIPPVAVGYGLETRRQILGIDPGIQGAAGRRRGRISRTENRVQRSHPKDGVGVETPFIGNVPRSGQSIMEPNRTVGSHAHSIALSCSPRSEAPIAESVRIYQ